jgi:glycosyltransferase involved in cell wall biosynthesis
MSSADTSIFMNNAPEAVHHRSPMPLRINYVAHLDPYLYTGGGEQVMRKLLDAAKRRGHDIKIASRDGSDLHESPDLWFLCDVYNCPMNQRRPIESLVDSVVRGTVPYVHHDNAYVDICRRDGLPCNGKGINGYDCHIKQGICSLVRAAPLYQNAAVCSFLSPLHRDVHIGALGTSVLPLQKTILYFPDIDVARFRNLQLKRDIGLLSYGGQGETKGYYNIMKNFPRGSVAFIGGNTPQLVKEGDGHWLGTVPSEMMPQLLNRTQNYIHVPRWPEPFGLIVAEAALCGCNIIVNDMVGAISWKVDLKDPKTYNNSLEKYWDELEGRIALKESI